MPDRFLFRLLLCLAALALPACGNDDAGAGSTKATTSTTDTSANRSAARATALGFPAPPPCRSAADPTPQQTEGPYYRPSPPRRRTLLESGVVGRRLLLRGRVLSTACRPLADARIDFWQADGNGEYDNNGYRLRGYQLTDSKGRYRLETVVPAIYEDRTRHIHVKVRPRGGTTLTTQLYFPGEAANRNDSIFVPATVIRLRRGSEPWRGAFNFVVGR